MVGQKTFLQLLKPDIVVAGTVLSLTPALLQQRGIRGIIFDVDDTLVPLTRAQASPEMIAWVSQIQQHFQVWLVSNNTSHARIQQIANHFGLPYINGAIKPSRRALRRAIGHMQLDPPQVAMVGDRLLTDILAGNRLGLLTVLVDPVRA